MKSNDIQNNIGIEKLINGYEIRFSIKESMLIIEAESTSNSKFYSVNINQSETAKLTGELFSNVESLYESLIEGIHKTDLSIKVSLSADGILNISTNLLLEKKEKPFEFFIALKEVELNSITILQKDNEKLKNMIHQKDEKISHFEQENYNLIKVLSSNNENPTEIVLEEAIRKQTMILKSKIVSEIEKQQVKLGIESIIKKQTLTLQSKICSVIEKQTQIINNKLSSVIEDHLEKRIVSQINKQSQTLENNTILQLKKQSQSL